MITHTGVNIGALLPSLSSMSTYTLPILELRLYRKLSTGRFEQIRSLALVKRNCFARGYVDALAQGYAHLEFAVSASEVTVTPLDASATGTEGLVGSVTFLTKDLYPVTLVTTDFIVETAGNNYNCFINGWVAEDRVELVRA